MLFKLKRTLNLYLASSWRVFKRMHIKHKWGSLAKDHGNTRLIKSLKPTLDCLQPILLIYKSGRLWSLVGKNNPSKTLYLKYCQTKREIYWLYWDLSKRPLENNVREGERWNTHKKWFARHKLVLWMHPDTNFRSGLGAATKWHETIQNLSFGPKVFHWACLLQKNMKQF